MADDPNDVGGNADDGDAKWRRYIRAASAIVMGVSILAMVFDPTLRGSDIAIGMFVSGLLILGGVDIDKLPFVGGRK